MNLQRLIAAMLLISTALVASPLASSADEPEAPGWYFKGDVGGVWTAGNSESNALGAAAELRRLWPNFRLRLRGAASQTQTTRITRTATGTQDDFDVNEDRDTEKTAEFYNLTLAGRYTISKYFFALGGVDWLRNRPSGIDSRTLLAIGAGNSWRDTADSKFSTYYNFTYTFEEDVVDNPIVSSDFPGLQAGYELDQKLTETARLESDLVADWNLDNTDDVRVDWFNALPVSLNSRLELKPSLRLLWRNDPALEEIPLVDGTGAETGDTVTAPLDELDTIFTLALVIKFQPDTEE